MRNEYPRRFGVAAGAAEQFQENFSTASLGSPQSPEVASAAVQQVVDETACRFLRLILPDKGPYAAFIVETGRKYNEFAPTIETLCNLIKSADQAGNTAYHACASFKEARHDPRDTPPARRRYGRTKRNAASARAFWLDVDAGPGKPYANWQSAKEEIQQFCSLANLPAPMLVRSGLGLHVYWPLQQMVDPGTWGRYANGLKALCVQHGLHADHSRTTDISSVLRTPGTHHRKDGVRLVECDEWVEPSSIDHFDSLLAAENGQDRQASTRRRYDDAAHEFRLNGKSYAWPESFQKIPAHVSKIKGHDLAGRVLRNWAPEPSDGEIIADRCAQVRSPRDNKGKIPEPRWYAALEVLAHCRNGDNLGHEWSSGHEKYIPEQTQERLDRSREFGPTTCKRFQELDARLCEGCPHKGKITSPIFLGRDRPSSVKRETNSGDRGEHVSDQGTAGQTGGLETNKNSVKAGTATQATEDHGRANSCLRWHGEKDQNEKPEYLVKRLLPKTGAGLISGQWGTGETFVALDLSRAVMTGGEFARHPVKRHGGVLFIAAEGAGEIPIRLAGLYKTKCENLAGEKLPFCWTVQYPVLMQDCALDELKKIAREAADELKTRFDIELVLIIIDTVAAAAGFKDENSSAEGQHVMNVLSELSRHTGALILACDHFGKVAETGTRGTSAKEAAADVVLACLGDKEMAGKVKNLRMAVRKLRGGATGAETEFALRVVDLGQDEDGEPVTTCVIDWSPAVVAPPKRGRDAIWPKCTKPLLTALRYVMARRAEDRQPHPERPAVRTVRLDEVREEFDKREPIDGCTRDRAKALAARRQKFKRALDSAVEKNLVEVREIDEVSFIWFTNPADEVERLASGRDSSVTT